jgi:hypothetical protein
MVAPDMSSLVDKLVMDSGKLLVIVPVSTETGFAYQAMAFLPEELALLEYTVHAIATNGAKPGDYFRTIDQSS